MDWETCSMDVPDPQQLGTAPEAVSEEALEAPQQGDAGGVPDAVLSPRATLP